MTIGARLKELRGGVPRHEFAALFGVTRATIQRYEYEERTPDCNFAAAVCNYFEVQPNWLILGKDPKYWKDNPKKTPAELDEGLITDAVVTLEKALEVTGKVMPPEAKAEIIIKIYELFSDEEQRARKDNILKFLKLVA